MNMNGELENSDSYNTFSRVTCLTAHVATTSSYNLVVGVVSRDAQKRAVTHMHGGGISARPLDS
jgi:hypothetical protein